MTWTLTNSLREVRSAGLPHTLLVRSELLLLRMRIEQLAAAVPPIALGAAFRGGRAGLRLWALVTLVEPDRYAIVRRRVLQVQRVYRLSSDYLHGRRSALIPSRAELAGWIASVAALENIVDEEVVDRG